MDFFTLKNELDKSSKIYNRINQEQEHIIKEELISFEKLMKYLDSVLPKEKISGVECTLIYVFDSSKKSSISPKVYHCEDGKIRFQVYKKEEYKGYSPNTSIKDGYAVVEPEEMFKYINLSDVYEFLVERIDTLKEIAEHTHEEIEHRKNFLNMFNKLFKSAK